MVIATKKPVDLVNVAIVMSPLDNVAVAKKDIETGLILAYQKTTISITETIPRGQRFALKSLKKEELLKTYGYPFAVSKGINQGQLITERNLRELPTDDYQELINNFKKSDKNCSAADQALDGKNNLSFMGYVRKDGRVGTRNYYLIMPTSLCASDLALKLANKFEDCDSINQNYPSLDGVVAAAHTEGCGCSDGLIIDRLLLTIKNTVAHPNVGGVLLIELGCEKTNEKVVRDALSDLKELGKPLDFISIQGVGGTRLALEEGNKIISKRLSQVGRASRKPADISDLVIGTECGASNSFSGITANPVIGNAVDKCINHGGSAIVSETPEMVGAEAALVERMTSVTVAKDFLNALNNYKIFASKLGVSLAGNLVPSNKKEGLLTPALKSLGAITKGGTSQIVDFLNYSELIKKPGVSIMDGPGNDLESVTGITASGANIILFSTGLGTNGGSLLAPVIKVPSTSEIFNKLSDDMDFDAGRLLTDDISIDELGDELLDLIVKIASGNKRTYSEIWKNRPFQIWSAGKLAL